MPIPNPVSVVLGDLQEDAEARVKSGAYASLDDVLRAGLRALDREEAAAEATLGLRVQEALDDPAAPLPAEQVIAELRAHHAKRLELAGRGVKRDA